MQPRPDSRTLALLDAGACPATVDVLPHGDTVAITVRCAADLRSVDHAGGFTCSAGHSHQVAALF